MAFGAVQLNLLLGSSIGGWEILLMCAVVAIFFGAPYLPELSRGISRGLLNFQKAVDEVSDELKPGFRDDGLIREAITHENHTAEFVFPHRSRNSKLLDAVILYIAQGFGVGRIPFAPGTWGSVIGVLWTMVLCSTSNLWLYLAGTVLGLAASVWFCGEGERILREKDPGSVVLDEIAALPICFLPLVAHCWWQTHHLPTIEDFLGSNTWYITLAVFALFRLFDIAKPWPVKQSQSLPGGWGITVDDALAGTWVALIVFFAGRFWLWR